MFLNDRGIGHVLTGVRRPPTIGKVESRLWRDTLNRELIKRFRFKDQEAFSAIGRSLPAKDLPDKDWQAGACGGKVALSVNTVCPRALKLVSVVLGF